MTRIKSMSIVGIALLGAACGGSSTSQVPTQELARSEASIRAASQAGAANHAGAAARLNVAKETTARAQKLASKGDTKAAKVLLDDAQADADLALALTHANDAEMRTEQARRRLQSVK
jgi:hypothetical protein